MIRLLVNTSFDSFSLPRSYEETVHLLTQNVLEFPFSTRLFPSPPWKGIPGGLLQIKDMCERVNVVRWLCRLESKLKYPRDRSLH